MGKTSEQFEWVTLTYGSYAYDVCVALGVEEVEMVRVLDTEADITPVMNDGVIDWMLEEALKEIQIAEGGPFFKDMSKREIEIDEEGY